jgi:hypothetical protein
MGEKNKKISRDPAVSIKGMIRLPICKERISGILHGKGEKQKFPVILEGSSG